MKKNEFTYAGHDLEALSNAKNYNKWILDNIEPLLGISIVEVGAGIGNLSEEILKKDGIVSYIAIEPSSKMFDLLKARLLINPQNKIITFYNSILSEIKISEEVNNNNDSFIYINVLEHIENDQEEIDLVFKLLPKSGKIFIFVPALPFLYSEFDKQIGHFRRYRKTELENICRNSGFTIRKSRYMDMIGIIPWIIRFKWMKSKNIDERSMRIYDKFIVPLNKLIENYILPPIGKNILIIAEKK